MNCPYCFGRTAVIDSRPKLYGIRRRRKCLICLKRFSTVEIEANGPWGSGDKDGDEFESWLTAIATSVPASVVARMDLSEVRGWFNSGVKLDHAIKNLQQAQQ